MLFDKRACCPGMPGRFPMPPQDAFVGGDCGCQMDPIVEQPIERCMRRDICHDIRHICPIHTKIINNHIYRHNYVPCYTCSEENIVTNLDQGSCCNFL